MNNNEIIEKRNAVIETMNHRFNSVGQHTKYRLKGIDPLEIHHCKSCATDRPACMFSIHRESGLNFQCRICYELKARNLPVRPVTLTELDESERVFNDFKIVAETQQRLWERRNPALAKIKNGTYR